MAMFSGNFSYTDNLHYSGSMSTGTMSPRTSNSSYSTTPPPSPPPAPLTLAEMFKDLWSPEFAAKYIHSTGIFATAELPSWQNNYCVSNYTVEKMALHQLREGYDIAVMETLIRHVPLDQRECFVAKVQSRVAKLVEKRRRLPLCGFCKNNGKAPQIYLSHTARDESGRVSCPTLYRYHCPRCGASGADAHTISYCPLNRASRH